MEVLGRYSRARPGTCDHVSPANRALVACSPGPRIPASARSDVPVSYPRVVAELQDRQRRGASWSSVVVVSRGSVACERAFVPARVRRLRLRRGLARGREGWRVRGATCCDACLAGLISSIGDSRVPIDVALLDRGGEGDSLERHGADPRLGLRAPEPALAEATADDPPDDRPREHLPQSLRRFEAPRPPECDRGNGSRSSSATSIGTRESPTSAVASARAGSGARRPSRASAPCLSKLSPSPHSTALMQFRPSRIPGVER